MSTLLTTNLKNASSGSNNIVLAADGTTTIAAPSNIIKSGTAVTSTSGTSIDFTGIPSWVKRVTVMLQGVSTSGSSSMLIRLGISSGFVASGYLGCSSRFDATALTTANETSGFFVFLAAASSVNHGALTLSNISGNNWVANGIFAQSDVARSSFAAGSIGLSGTLDRVRITTVNGTDTFDAGSINILYEG
jgi:hypothetical protein